METFSAGALGQAIKELRHMSGMTQEGLGREAGYKRGAGVSISRIENGQMEPSEERFEGLAEALGVSPDELAARAAAAEGTVRAARASLASLRERASRLEEELEYRSLDIADTQDGFNMFRDQAKDAFLMKLVELAPRIEGVSNLNPARPAEGVDDETEAAFRLHFLNLGVQHALAVNARDQSSTATPSPASAYEAFMASLGRGLLSARSSIPEDSNAAPALGAVLAATRIPTPATLGGALGAVALGTTAAAAFALFSQQRNRQNISAKLDELEAAFAATEENAKALKWSLVGAGALLEYIAVHAGHAVDRWEKQLGPGQVDLRDRAGEQETYRAFIEVAAAQLAVANMDFRDLITSRGEDLKQSEALIESIVDHAWEVVVSHV